MIMNKNNLAIGLMSGTSADGLTAALCCIEGKKIRVLDFANYEYSADLHNRIVKARDLRTPALSALNFELGRLWGRYLSDFFKRNGLQRGGVCSVASHGQTVWHYPAPEGGNTLQIGEASFLCEETGCPVVCDFRPADMAAGGEGAPLVPFFDEWLYGDGDPVALQNIGGVGNIAFAGRGISVSGFDTGPGNSLMDSVVSVKSRGTETYDAGGKLAASGHPDLEKVRKMLETPYFSEKPPKSLERSVFSEKFVYENFGAVTEENSADIMATLNMFTAASIADAFKRFAPPGVKKIVIAGGGALNPVLMSNIKLLFADIGVKALSSAEEGLHPLAKEAACFALMGFLAVNRRTNHCPAATGAKGERILGKIILPVL